MNSTKFFRKWLLPKKKKYFETTFDQQLSSYFSIRKNPQMTRSQLEWGADIHFSNLETKLTHFWSESGDTDLKPLAKPLAELAKSVYSIDSQSEEVSPFIYVMY